ncbi:N-acetyltransferase [Longispora fulva]|nr:N-acetyltransferase [Longispora fulva]
MTAYNSAMAEIIIRRVTPSDAAAVRALRLEALATAPLAFGSTLAEVQARPVEFWTEQIAKNSTGGEVSQFLAVADGRLLGSVIGSAEGDLTFIYGVYVRPEARGLGLLDRLTEAVAAWSVEHGRTELRLDVGTHNQPAVNAYRRLGFTETGHTAPYEHGEGLTELDEMEMSKVLA